MLYLYEREVRIMDAEGILKIIEAFFNALRQILKALGIMKDTTETTAAAED